MLSQSERPCNPALAITVWGMMERHAEKVGVSERVSRNDVGDREASGVSNERE